MSKTTISWTEETWNPLRARNVLTGEVGWACVRVSIECTNCYACGLNLKPGSSGGTGLDYKPGHIGKNVELFLAPGRLSEPRSWRKPKMVFVCSMTDLFWESYPDAWLDQVFAAIALAPRSVFQVLTKRHVRMCAYMNDPETPGRIARAATAITGQPHTSLAWPLQNVWLGVSAGTQEYAEARVPKLLATPAVVHWVSAEPLLGPVSFARWLQGDQRLDWIVVGGESLPLMGDKANIRPMSPGWARSIRDECQTADVPFHFKQWGNWGPDGVWRRKDQNVSALDGREDKTWPSPALRRTPSWPLTPALSTP